MFEQLPCVWQDPGKSVVGEGGESQCALYSQPYSVHKHKLSCYYNVCVRIKA